MPRTRPSRLRSRAR